MSSLKINETNNDDASENCKFKFNTIETMLSVYCIHGEKFHKVNYIETLGKSVFYRAQTRFSRNGHIFLF